MFLNGEHQQERLHLCPPSIEEEIRCGGERVLKKMYALIQFTQYKLISMIKDLSFFHVLVEDANIMLT